MNSKRAAGLAGLLLFVGAGLYLVMSGGERRPRASDPGLSALPPAPEAGAPLLREGPIEQAPAPAALRQEEVRPEAAAAAPRPWRGELAGVTGRVVESDGVPVTGLRVALLEFDPGLLFDGTAIDAPTAELQLDEAVTDDEGRFVLGGARAPLFHGLGLDLGGPRATVRVIDQALVHRERTDLGDIVMAPYGVLVGRLLDESGNPVAGGRVRAGPFPEEILVAMPWEFRSDSLVAVSLLASGGDSRGIVEPPGWVRAALDRLPVPTTLSRADGTFRLEGVALARIVGGVDKPGYVGVPIGPVEMGADAGAERDLGDLILTRGRTLRGVVEDATGDPVVGAEVYAGAEVAPGTAAILQPCGATDGEGRFELVGVPPQGQAVAVARRASHEAWGITFTAREENILVELETLVRLTVNVRDEQGEPLPGARLQLTPTGTDQEDIGLREALAFLPRPANPEGLFREVEPGRYANERLCAGVYELTVRVPGLAPTSERVDCRGEVNEVTLTCRRGRLLEVSVIDGGTREPVPAARVSLMRFAPTGLSKLAVETTDGQGRARLGPVAPPGGPGGARGFMPEQTTLLVQHPRYGELSIPLEIETFPTVPMVIPLGTGGVLEGRVHWGGAVPTRLYMLDLEPRDTDGPRALFHLPRLALTGIGGEFRVANLPPGKYRVELLERFLDQDPLGMVAAQFSPTLLHREEVEIEDGRTTELIIDLTPSGRGPTARVYGRVRVDGRPLEGAEVQLQGAESVRVRTDASGRFETADFAVRDSVRLRITGDVRLPDGSLETGKELLRWESLELKPDEVREVELDLYPLSVPVLVVEAATGRPLAEAQVRAQLQGSGNRSWSASKETSAQGEAALLVLEPGAYSLRASAPGFAPATISIEVPLGGLAEPVRFGLTPALPCAGRVLLSAAGRAEGPRSFSYLWVRGEDNGVSASSGLKAPDYAFELEGMAPGKYRVYLYLDGQQGEEQSFVLGPDGDRNLVVNFIPAQAQR